MAEQTEPVPDPVSQWNERVIKAKVKAVERHAGSSADGLVMPQTSKDRLPPGQYLTEKFPVLDLGHQPDFDPATWELRIDGAVAHPARVSWQQFADLPTVTRTRDFHCVTKWSTYDLTWTGVAFELLCDMVDPDPEATFVLQHGADGYTTNVSLKEMIAGDCMIAYKLNGEPLPREHGAPARIILPKLYAWKGAKFLSRLEFKTEDSPGFWEVRGYHEHGDPWNEERFA